MPVTTTGANEKLAREGLQFDVDFMLESRLRAVLINNPRANTIPLSITEAKRVLAALSQAPNDQVDGDLEIAALGALLVLLNKAQAATDCLAVPDWKPGRAHLVGARNAMIEAIECLQPHFPNVTSGGTLPALSTNQVAIPDVEAVAIDHAELERRMREFKMFGPSIDAVLAWTRHGVRAQGEQEE